MFVLPFWRMCTPLRPRMSEAVFLVAIIPRRLKLHSLKENVNQIDRIIKERKG
jgi:hypothetical protein